MKKKLISIVTGCYNEEENVELLYKKVKEIMSTLPHYDYEHIFIDNASTDKTVPILKRIATEDSRVKVIVNSRNFGQIRSAFYAFLQSSGDAIITIVCDFQEPPELIPEFIKKWEEGYKIVVAVKTKSKEFPLLFMVRKFYYALLKRLSDEVEQIENFTGFGLYDAQVREIFKEFNDPYPYFRGLVGEIGFERAEIEFEQPVRKRGKSKNNFYTLYEMAMTGFVNYSKFPLRLSVFIGFFTAVISLIIAIFYFVYKLLFWDRFEVGIAPLVIGFFFFSAVQLFFIGIIGEYIGATYNYIKHRPLVIEKERINF